MNKEEDKNLKRFTDSSVVVIKKKPKEKKETSGKK